MVTCPESLVRMSLVICSDTAIIYNVILPPKLISEGPMLYAPYTPNMARRAFCNCVSTPKITTEGNSLFNIREFALHRSANANNKVALLLWALPTDSGVLVLYVQGGNV